MKKTNLSFKNINALICLLQILKLRGLDSPFFTLYINSLKRRALYKYSAKYSNNIAKIYRIVSLLNDTKGSL